MRNGCMGVSHPRLMHGLGWCFATPSCVLDNKAARESQKLPERSREVFDFPELHQGKE
jgi:hypothetical protein